MSTRGRLAAAVGCLLALAIPAQAQTGSLGVRGRIAGVAIRTDRGPAAATVAADIDRLAADGINTVLLDVWWDVHPTALDTLVPGARTTSDADLLASFELAHRRGLKVSLMPKFWCPSCIADGDITWRGNYRPADVANFFASYRLFIDHYADVAAQGAVDIFFVGSELQNVDRYTAQWRALIADVRSRFHGKLAYQANWGTSFDVRFWDRVDMICIAAYFPLTSKLYPTTADLRRAWRRSAVPGRFHGKDWVAILRKLSKRWHRPILFGEAGYLSHAQAAEHPASATATAAADQRTQANAYQALLQTFAREKWWLGVVWWDWSPLGGDRSYSPRGKLAEGVLRSTYG